MDTLLAGTLSPLRGFIVPVLMSSAALPVENYSGLIVKTIPGRCENPFAFTPEPLFTISPGIVFIFIPERFSRSPRNPVHLAPESASGHRNV
ncbi:MAG: hypothetical protein JO270_08035 [Acidobacteriaceae bacterium]|nr:hypothetical protein [Acidobacteriaceae bacterium]MBV8572330.1 hypothetical protein [Acidobacteriaceae bacterium]